MTTPAYGSAAYWEDRYRRDPEAFDWYQQYAGVRECISAHVRKSDAILHIGCGTSRLAEEMYDDGFASMVNVDTSQSAIEVMRSRNEGRAAGADGRSGLSWAVMDACALTFPDASFDVVLDKGCLDSVLCGEGSGSNSSRLLGEAWRVLRPGGHVLIISYGEPDVRAPVFEADKERKWRHNFVTVPKPTIAGSTLAEGEAAPTHYIYILQKPHTTTGLTDTH